MFTHTRTLIVPLTFTLAAFAAVSAHMAYSKSVPAQNATVSKSPSELQVWFTQDPEPAVSRLSLQGPTGEISLGKTIVDKDRSIAASVENSLSPGSYIVSWRAAGDDGHVLRGEFSFTVLAAN